MNVLDDRQNAFENKFKHDAELQFKVGCRTSHIFGIWAASELGLTGGEADAYAKTVVEADFEEPGFDDILRKVRADFKDKKLDVSEHKMTIELDKAENEAKAQVMGEE